MSGAFFIPGHRYGRKADSLVSFSRTDLLQTLSILAMERPVSFSAEDIRDEKVRVRCLDHTLNGWTRNSCRRLSLTHPPSSFRCRSQVKVLRCIPPIQQKDTLLGQYTGADGKPGYLEDDTVPKGSTCPTFAALTLWINNPRWEGVPFIMKAGKGECPKMILSDRMIYQLGRVSTLTSLSFMHFARYSPQRSQSRNPSSIP